MEEKFITHIGTDESGKGDFFGPLVIAGVMVDEKDMFYCPVSTSNAWFIKGGWDAV